MSNKILFSIIIGLVILIGGVFIFSKNNHSQPPKNNGDESQMTLFYMDGCPHCKAVEDFIKENKINEKISFQEKEVSGNKENASELIDKAKICGLATDAVGVPFLWDGSQCLVGDKDIIDFLKQKISGG